MVPYDPQREQVEHHRWYLLVKYSSDSVSHTVAEKKYKERVRKGKIWSFTRLKCRCQRASSSQSSSSLQSPASSRSMSWSSSVCTSLHDQKRQLFKEAKMVLPSTFLCLLSLTLVSGNPLSDDRTTRRPRRREEEKERKVSTGNQDRQHRSVNSQDNQEGNPPGVNFSGMLNVTATGRTCQVWAASQPHEHDFPDVGKHNHCRNPDGDIGGVWCYTTALLVKVVNRVLKCTKSGQK